MGGANIDLLLIGVSHKTAPVAVRERLAVEPDAIRGRAGRADRAVGGARGGDDLHLQPRRAVRRRRRRGSRGRRLAERARAAGRRRGRPISPSTSISTATSAAVRHLFRVASSLDSLVVGEPQILGQTKQAYDAAVQHGTAGAVLRTCFEEGAFRAARRVRRETAIARNPVSVSSVAVEFARQVVRRLRAPPRAGRRRGQDVGARGAHAAHARRDADGHQPDARARRGAGASASAPTSPTGTTCERALDRADIVIASTGAQRPVLTLELHHAGAQGAPRAAALSCWTSPSRATSIRRRGSWTASTVSTSTICRSRRARTAPSARRRPPRRRPSSSRSWAGS